MRYFSYSPGSKKKRKRPRPPNVAQNPPGQRGEGEFNPTAPNSNEGGKRKGKCCSFSPLSRRNNLAAPHLSHEHAEGKKKKENLKY